MCRPDDYPPFEDDVKDTVTANELIAMLQEARMQHGNLGVMTEGCDCDGTARGIRLLKRNDTSYLIITREETKDATR